MRDYIKTNWKSGDLITEANLNKIETQLADTTSEIKTLNNSVADMAEAQEYLDLPISSETDAAVQQAYAEIKADVEAVEESVGDPIQVLIPQEYTEMAGYWFATGVNTPTWVSDRLSETSVGYENDWRVAYAPITEGKTYRFLFYRGSANRYHMFFSNDETSGANEYRILYNPGTYAAGDGQEYIDTAVAPEGATKIWVASKCTAEEASEKLQIQEVTEPTVFAHIAETQTRVATLESGLTTTNSDVDALETRMAVAEGDIKYFNTHNILFENGEFNDKTLNAVTFTWDASRTICTINAPTGPSGNPGNRFLYNDSSLTAAGLKAGETYLFDVTSTHDKCMVDLFWYTNGTLGTQIFITEPTLVTVPLTATGVLSRVYVRSNAGVLTNEKVRVGILTAVNAEYVNDELKKRIWPKSASSYVSSSTITLGSIVEDGRYIIDDSWTATDGPAASFPNGFVLTVENFSPTSTAHNFAKQTVEGLLGTASKLSFTRMKIAGNWTSWQSVQPLRRATITPTGNTTNRKTDIEAALTSDGVAILAPGDYYVSGIVMPDNTELRGSGMGNTRLILISGSTGTCVKMGTCCNVSDLTLYGLEESIPTANNERHGLGWVGTFQSELSPGTYPRNGAAHDIYIEGFAGGGVYCTGTSMLVNTGIQITNVSIYHCWAGIYVKTYSEFSAFTNVRAWGCTYGCFNNGGNNIFTNCNFSMNTTALVMDDTGSQAPNNSHGSFVGCVFNHSGGNYGYAMILTGLDSGEVFSGCQIFYGKTKVTDCVGIKFIGCNYGRRTDLEITGSDSVVFDSCQFKAAADTPLTQSNNSGLRFVNCTTYDGEEFDPTRWNGQYTVHNDIYINKSSGILTSNSGFKVISFHVDPYTTYEIKKNTASVLRAGAFSTDSGVAGDTLINLMTHETSDTTSVTVYTNRFDYLYIQLWAANDDAALKTIEAHLPTLTITPVDTGSLEAIASLKNALCDTSNDFTEVSNLYIHSSSNKILSPGSNYSVNTNEHRLISVPITGGKRYRIWCDVQRNMLAGSGDAQIPAQEKLLRKVYQNNGTSKFFDVDTDEGDSYIYIQLFTNADSHIYAPQYYVNRMIVYELGTVPRKRLPYNGEDIVEICHRGLHDAAPENTIHSFRAAKADGYTWIECDVQVTSDGVPVICHDASINRTARNADGTEISGTVNIGQTTYADLLTYDFGIAMGSEYAGTKIPTLAEIMDFARKAGIKVAIELKNDTVNATNFLDIYDIVKAYSMESFVEFFSGTINTAKIAAMTVKNGIVGLAVNSTTVLTAIDNLNLLRLNNNIVWLHADPTDDSAAQLILDQAAANGYEIIFRGHTLAQIALAPDYAHMFISNNLHPKAVLYEEAMGHEMP